MAFKRPFHERIWPLGSLRRLFRNAFFRFLRKVANTDDAKAIQVSMIQNLLPRRAQMLADNPYVPNTSPYPDLGQVPQASQPTGRSDVVIITARFRSGSTLLWNLFRAQPGCTAYYEPFNERRWFDPASHGSHTDPTHRGVDDYWTEYQGLEELGQYYQESWIDHNLLMYADSWDLAMKRYVERLIELAPARPVLQFNRIDFRLPWFRRIFPRAKIVHLYRHPRDQWCSSLLNPHEFPYQRTMAEFASHDHFYLGNWAKDLKYHFPFLDETAVSHPYRLFYYIWKLSYLYGRRDADISLSYEDLVKEPERCLAQLFREIQMPDSDLAKLARLVEKPQCGRWREYANQEWFQQHESYCEAVMADFFQGTSGRLLPPREGAGFPVFQHAEGI
jgi:Sulfotransferase family